MEVEREGERNKEGMAQMEREALKRERERKELKEENEGRHTVGLKEEDTHLRGRGEGRGE